ncbi:ABC transporter ATP-binding protein [Aurantivibrio plasticivorans]
MSSSTSILSVKDLVVSFETEDGKVEVLNRIGFTLNRGESLGLVGESGCGKSVAAFSILRLLPQPSGNIDDGVIDYDGKNLLSLPIEEMHNIRGRKIAMIFQEPMTALNPVHRIGKQIGEVYRLHFPEMSEEDIKQASIDILKKVAIPAPEKRLNEYPHQLSGGMRQRAMIAMALACKPDILIADEPTTALDVTTQNQILKLIQDLQQEIGMSVLFITHDLGVIAETCDRVIVMYAGCIVEEAPVRDLFKAPKHPYTRGLLNSIPILETESKSELQTIPGMVPSLRDLPSGCRFRTRCEFATSACSETEPQIEAINDDPSHRVACHRWRELAE